MKLEIIEQKNDIITYQDVYDGCFVLNSAEFRANEADE